MDILPQQYREMISAQAPLRDYRVALIGELDKAERNPSYTGTSVANILETQLRAGGIELFEADDSVIDFAKEKDVDMVKAALCTNFSREKFEFAIKMIASKGGEHTTTGRNRRAEQEVVGGLSDLRSKAESGKVSPKDLKRDLKVAILRELDLDQRREIPIAEKVAEDAHRKLSEAGDGLFEDDDGSVVFQQVGRPNVTEDALYMVTAALATNFSREKLRYANQVQIEFRRRGYDRYQVKKRTMKGAIDPAPSKASLCVAEQSHPDNTERCSTQHRRGRSVGGTAKWILAVATAAVFVVVALIIKTIKK